MLSNLASLAFDHDRSTSNTNMKIRGQQATICRTSSLSTTITLQWRKPISAIAAMINEYVRIYLSIYISCVCFYCFSYNHSPTHVCLSLSTVLYINNNADASSIKSIANTSFAPSPTGTPQKQQQLQLERNPTMAMAMTMIMAIVTHRQQHSSGMRTGNRKRKMETWTS